MHVFLQTNLCIQSMSRQLRTANYPIAASYRARAFLTFTVAHFLAPSFDMPAAIASFLNRFCIQLKYDCFDAKLEYSSAAAAGRFNTGVARPAHVPAGLVTTTTSADGFLETGAFAAAGSGLSVIANGCRWSIGRTVCAVNGGENVRW